MRKQVWLKRRLEKHSHCGTSVFTAPAFIVTVLCQEVHSSLLEDEWPHRTEMSYLSCSPQAQAECKWSFLWGQPRPNSPSWDILPDHRDHPNWFRPVELPSRSCGLWERLKVSWFRLLRFWVIMQQNHLIDISVYLQSLARYLEHSGWSVNTPRSMNLYLMTLKQCVIGSIAKS